MSYKTFTILYITCLIKGKSNFWGGKSYLKDLKICVFNMWMTSEWCTFKSTLWWRHVILWQSAKEIALNNIIAIDTMEDFKRRDVIRDISKIKIKSVNSWCFKMVKENPFMNLQKRWDLKRIQWQSRKRKETKSTMYLTQRWVDKDE